jgi:hypothetical protein
MDAHLARFESELASQKGLVTLDQLRVGRLSVERIRSLIDRQVLRRIRPRVFGLVGATDSWERGLLAVTLSVKGSVASHAAAARLWGLEPRPESRYEITVPRDRHVLVRGVVVHRSGTIGERDTSTRHGIVTTSFERTLCDCTTLLSRHQLGRALDDGLRRGVASVKRLKDCSERTESAPGRHMSVTRALLAERGIGFDPGGSQSELDVLKVLRRAGLPEPVQQYRVKIGSKTFRPDFAWPEVIVFAEYYGLLFHAGASAVIADSARLTALAAAGWVPLVFTHASSEREIVERTASALLQRGVGGKIGA